MKYPDLKLGDKSPFIVTAKALLNSQGFFQPAGDQFDENFQATLVSFQGSHKGPDGKPLNAIGILGQKTWWALQNPTGPAQRSFMELQPGRNEVPKSITATRQAVLEAALKMWRANTREIPAGSNWGDGVSKILAKAGSARPWCCHTIGHAFVEGTGRYLWGRDWGLVSALWNEAEKRGCAHTKASGYVPRPCDLGVTLYRNAAGRLKGTGHIWFMVALGPKPSRGVGRAYNHLGGNEGDRLHLGLRNTMDESLHGWINPFGDDDIQSPLFLPSLPFQPNLERAKEAFAATR
jgi:hypothetical protein